MVPNILEQREKDERAKDAYWICLVFLLHGDIRKRDAVSVLDNQNLVARLDHAYARLNNYREKAYWLWHDSLDIVDFLAPYDQDWLDETQPQEEKERIENGFLQPDQSCKTFWYWLDLIDNATDEVDQKKKLVFTLKEPVNTG